MPYKDDIWDWSGTDVKVVNATVVLEGVSVITAEPSENAIEPLERADVELLLPIQIISKEEEPTVSQLEIIDFGTTSIECEFEVTTQQADEVVRGILCGTTNPPTFDNADYRLLHGQGVVDITFVGLNNDTEYYLRPYALSNLGYKYGDVIAQRTKVSPIPSEYQLVEYLESTGTQYINTGYVANSSSYFKLDYEYTSANSSQCGAGTGADINRFIIARINGFFYSGLGKGVSRGSININQRYNIEINSYRDYAKIDDIVYNQESTLQTTNYPVGIFGRYETSATRPNYVHRAKCYGAELGEADIPLYKLYPVYRKSDNKPGMYDIVNGGFYINQGTGEFVVGPDKEWEE